jgi:hypothetical protein
MVSLGRKSRSGAGRLGCLVSLALFAAALYYGFNIGQVYFRYYQLLDAMRTQAQLAPSLNDDVIQRRLIVQAYSLFRDGSPLFYITRGVHPKRIIITTEFT